MTVNVGIAYDLRQDYLKEGYSELETAEFDRPDTIDAVEGALRSLGYRTDRIGHVRRLAERLVAGDRWDIVFSIAEGLRGLAREAQVPCLLEAYGIPFVFSDPVILALTMHKGLTKRVIRDLGIPTADFAVVESPSDIAAVDLPFPLFAKPVAEGTGKGVDPASKVRTRAELDAVSRRLLDQFRQPVLVETYLPGREFTVGIVGTGEKAEALGALEIVLLKGAEAEVYSYVNKEECETLVEYRLVDDPESREACRTALRSWRGLGCRDAGRVDLRSDARGVPHFIEVNPLAGIHPEHSDLPILCNRLGIPYRDLIRRIMDSAVERAGLKG